MNEWELTPEEKSQIRERIVRLAPQFSADREIFMIDLAGKEAQEKLVVWGEKPCVEHSEVEWPKELGGGTEHRQKVKHRRCQHCWQALEDAIKKV